MKGYPTTTGYKGLVGTTYMLFETEEAYYEYMEGMK